MYVTKTYILYNLNPWERNHRDGSMGHNNVLISMQEVG